jgi:L-threonylcarbamoyladenylate synthase
VDIILDGGPCSVGVESTVLSLLDKPRILREGGTPREAIEALIGPVESGADKAHETDKNRSPGQLKSHYAPRTKLRLLERDAMLALEDEQNALYLFFDGKDADAWKAVNPSAAPPACQGGKVFVLSRKGSDREAAAALFETLHEMDAYAASRGADVIYAERAADAGLGAAINDRLTRASAA